MSLRARLLFGTEEPVPSRRRLSAGPLDMEFEDGAIRWIRFGDVELLRGILFLVRDRNWGTLASCLTDIELRQEKDCFHLAFEAECRGVLGRLCWSGAIAGASDGSLQFRGAVQPAQDFETSRTGFILLHPLDRLVGAPVEIGHGDGSRSKSRFPELIRSEPLWTSIRSLSYEPAPGLRLLCTMEGDLWECEDQRNWGDASFKTYSRPTSLPSPYLLPAGVRMEQVVTLSLCSAPVRPHRARQPAVSIAVGGDTSARMPQIGISACPADGSSYHAETLATLGAQWVSCRLDLRQPEIDGRLRSYRLLAERLNSKALLEIVLSGEGDPVEELHRVAASLQSLSFEPAALILNAAADMFELMPAGIAIDWRAVYAAARKAFPAGSLGGGSLGSFYQLNRKRPAVDSVDFVTHSTSCVVHAADDRSIMETLQTLPHQIRSARGFCGSLPYCVGPANIGMEFNPDGQVTPNPLGQRLTMVRDDPRQKSQFGAAWAAGYLAQATREAVQRVTIGATSGPFGVITKDGVPCPIFHVLKSFASAAGNFVLSTDSAAPDRVQVIACRSESRRFIWLANLRDRWVKVRLHNLSGHARALVLDLAHSTDMRSPVFEGDGTVELSNEIALDAFAVTRIELLP